MEPKGAEALCLCAAQVEAVDMPTLHAAGEEINTALTNPFFGVL